jgi:rhodanese-related sulfurtransferase
MVLAAGLLVFIAWKYWQRRRFYKALRLARITPEDLHQLIDEGKEPLVFDVRTAGARAADPRRIPGARVFLYPELEEKVVGLPHDREIVLYCT